MRRGRKRWRNKREGRKKGREEKEKVGKNKRIL